MVKPLKPIFKRFNFQEGHWEWGLGPEDFGRVQAGYACERCLEPFNHHVSECYVCGHPQQHHITIGLPREWQKQGA